MIRAFLFGPELMIRLHAMAAVYWIGAMIFLVVVATPILDRIRPPSFQRDFARRLWQLAHGTMWIAAATVLFTGAMLIRGSGVARSVLHAGFWFTPFGIKLLLVAAILVLSVLHDMLLGYGARLVDPSQSTNPPGTAGRVIPWVIAIAGTIIIALSVAPRPVP